ncbi:MAG: NusB antitermination factor [Francisellaceae bacterium]|nr:NusB antitermination factor [Francisellaceae bacterium]
MTNFNHRRKARRYSLQALYSWELSNNSLAKVEENILLEKAHKKFDIEYFKEILYGVPQHLTELQDSFIPYLNIGLEELDTIELTVLRIATYEFKYRLDIPYKVIINEALELTKMFGSIEGFKFVNGVLDKVSKDLRQSEQAIK